MPQFTTELLNFLAQKQDIDKFFFSYEQLTSSSVIILLGYDPSKKKFAIILVIVVTEPIHGNLKPNMGLFSSLFQEIVMGTLVQL